MADSYESAENHHSTADSEEFIVKKKTQVAHGVFPRQIRPYIDLAGRAGKQAYNSPLLQTIQARPVQGNRRWPLTPPMNQCDSRKTPTSFNTTPNSNHSGSTPSVLPPDVEASLTCLLAAAKSFSTVMTNYDISELTKVREAVTDLTDSNGIGDNRQITVGDNLVATRDLSLSNLYPSNINIDRGSVTQIGQGKFNLLRSGSKTLASQHERNELERLQLEITQTMKKCEDTFKTLVPSTAISSAVESRHFPDISLSVTKVSSSDPPSHYNNTKRANGISILADLIPAIILGRKDLTLARKFMAVKQNVASGELQLLIYTLKTRTKMEQIQLKGLSVRKRDINDVDVAELYGVLPFDLTVMKDPDMTGLIEFRGVSTSFAILLADKHVDTWFRILSDALNG